MTIASDVQPDRDVTFAAAVAGPTAFAVDLRGGARVEPRTVNAGAYTIVPTGAQSGLYNTSFTCAVDGAAGPRGSGRSVAVTVGKDEEVICTFTHIRKTGPHHLCSHPGGGNASPDQWTFAVTSAGLTGVRAGTPVDVPTGVYGVTAGGPATYRLVGATGACVDASGVKLAVDEGGGTCAALSPQPRCVCRAYGVSRVQEGQLTGAAAAVAIASSAACDPWATWRFS
ncbi:MAG: hypothetical protein R2838_10415 [Caldilineaceae bacterium]